MLRTTAVAKPLVSAILSSTSQIFLLRTVAVNSSRNQAFFDL